MKNYFAFFVPISCIGALVLIKSMRFVLFVDDTDGVHTTSMQKKFESSDAPNMSKGNVYVDSSPRWTQMSINESHNCSAHPFQHCCLGQCRQSALQIEKTKALWKLVDGDSPEGGHNLANLTDVLKYFGGNLQRSQSSPCTIVFAGDSLSSDHAMGANCQLLNSGYELTSCNLKTMGRKLYGDDTSVQCKANVHPSMNHILLRNDMAETCKEVLIIPSMPEMSPKELSEILESMNENGGLFVFNWGVHCNRQGSCISSKLTQSILPFVTGPYASKYAKWKFIFRETEPQHFRTVDGTYKGKAESNYPCSPIDSEKVESNNWRNREVEWFLSEHNLTDKIKTIRLYDTLVPLWQLHHPEDCTHYCYDPYRFDVTWDGLLKALLS